MEKIIQEMGEAGMLCVACKNFFFAVSKDENSVEQCLIVGKPIYKYIKHCNNFKKREINENEQTETTNKKIL